MRIAMVSTEAGSGGAARAMQRLARGLRDRGHIVEVFVSKAASSLDHEFQVLPQKGDPATDHFAKIGATFLDQAYIAARRTAVSNTSFSTQIAGFDLAALPIMQTYDIINIHWTGSMMTPSGLGRLIDLGVPVAFTLHDMAHFTGGCHYSAGCKGFEATCEACHQVTQDELGLIPHSLREKRKYYHRAHVEAISPSTWLAREADASQVFHNPVRVISNSIEIDVFKPRDRHLIREQLGLKDDTKALLFGVYDNQERRKGYDHLVDVLKRSLRYPSFAHLAEEDRLRFITFGKSQADLEALGVPLLDLGWISDDSGLSEIYSAADLCILPSREDNQPNIMLEAMACGTPIVAFRVGGIPETVIDGETGRLIDAFDCEGMAKAVVDLMEDDAVLSGMGQAAARAMQSLTLGRQAEAYEALFNQMSSDSHGKPSWTNEENVLESQLESRTLLAPFILDQVIEMTPLASVFADQIEALSENLTAVTTNRDIILEQLKSLAADHGALQQELTKIRSDVQFLKQKPLNRLLLKLRSRFTSQK